VILDSSIPAKSFTVDNDSNGEDMIVWLPISDE